MGKIKRKLLLLSAAAAVVVSFWSAEAEVFGVSIACVGYLLFAALMLKAE